MINITQIQSKSLVHSFLCLPDPLSTRKPEWPLTMQIHLGCYCLKSCYYYPLIAALSKILHVAHKALPHHWLHLHPWVSSSHFPSTHCVLHVVILSQICQTPSYNYHIYDQTPLYHHTTFTSPDWYCYSSKILFKHHSLRDTFSIPRSTID